jgi:NHL repeat
VKKLVLGLIAGCVGLVSPAAFAQSEIPFDTNLTFFHGLPDNLYLGEASGIAVSADGKKIAVFSRGNTTGPAYGATASQLLEFDATGKFVREIGHSLYAWSFAHAIRYDKYGNLWAVDKGSNMIVKFNPEGRPVMVFGRKAEASDEGAEPLKHPNPPLPAVNGQFRQPTDVAFDKDDNLFISDGYINSRIAKFDKDGHWIKQWGDRGTAEGMFNTPHTMTNDKDGNIYVGDRGNRRIQVFDNDGKLLRVIHIDVPVPSPLPVNWMGPTPNAEAAARTAGAPWAICITPPNASGKQFLYSADSYPGRIYKLDLDGKVLGFFGHTGRAPKEFGWVHELACPSENTVYAAEILNWRIQKLTLHPDKATTTSASAQ